MITMTLADLLDAEIALAALEQLSLPVKTAYHVAKLTRLVNAETQLFKQQRDVLIREFGAERPTTDAERAAGAGPTTVQVTPEHWTTYLARAQELGDVSIEIAWRPLMLAQLDGVTLRPADLRRLGPLLLDELEASDPPVAPAVPAPGRAPGIVD